MMEIGINLLCTLGAIPSGLVAAALVATSARLLLYGGRSVCLACFDLIRFRGDSVCFRLCIALRVGSSGFIYTSSSGGS